METATVDLLMDLNARTSVLQEAVMQLLEQLIAPDAAAATRFEAGMRARTNALLEGDLPPDQPREATMTQVLAALLESAGRPPQRG